jgi:hypothetical protein
MGISMVKNQITRTVPHDAMQIIIINVIPPDKRNTDRHLPPLAVSDRILVSEIMP